MDSPHGDQGERTNPDWSPDGRRIAFQSLTRGLYQITTLTVRDRNVRQHTDVGVNEDPAWAPDGRHIVFSSTRGGSQQIWILDSESGVMRQLTMGSGKTRMAAWSPRHGAPGAIGAGPAGPAGGREERQTPHPNTPKKQTPPGCQNPTRPPPTPGGGGRA